MRRSALVLAIVLVISLLATTGCSGLIKQGVENATGVKVEGDKVTVNKDGQSVEIGGAKSGTLPEGFPTDYPMYEPITITSGVKATSNGTHYTVTADAAATFDEVQKFYAEKLKAAGWEVETNGTATNGAGSGTVIGTKGTDKTTVALLQTGADQKVQIVLTLDMAQ